MHTSRRNEKQLELLRHFAELEQQAPADGTGVYESALREIDLLVSTANHSNILLLERYLAGAMAAGLRYHSVYDRWQWPDAQGLLAMYQRACRDRSH
jgi:hypothetical protein